MKIEIRPMEAGDRDYIANTWLRANYMRSGMAKSIPRGVYLKEHNKLINYFLDFATVSVACDNDGFILGFICFENITRSLETYDLLHYLFVRQEIRKKGIGTSLVNNMKRFDDIFYTHQGDIYKLWDKYEKKVFNPYLFWGSR